MKMNDFFDTFKAFPIFPNLIPNFYDNKSLEVQGN